MKTGQMMTSIGLAALAAVLLSACATSEGKPYMSKTEPTWDLGFQDAFVSDVIDVREKHLSPDYWLTQASNDVLMSVPDIQSFNAASIASDDTLNNIAALPGILSREALTDIVRSISNIPSYPRIYSDGTEVTADDFARYEAMLNLSTIGASNPVRYALTVKRTSIRTYPTNDLLFSHDAKDRDIERFQESVLFPGDAVAVLHESTDRQWALIQSYNYTAWVRKSDIALGDKSSVLDYGNTDNFLLITGDKVSTVYNPEVPAVSELQLDMGVRLPLSRPDEFKNSLYGQNPYLNHMVLLPVRKSDGSLDFKHALIQRKADVNIGYLPHTQANIIKQSFKFLGERYGWGHRYNGRDCTGFVLEIYKTFGFLLPRNSGDQRDSDIGQNDRFAKHENEAEKIERLKNAAPGDLVYIPGHVLMVLGQSDGQPFAIHDVHGMRYKRPDGSIYIGTLNGVSVTPILPLMSNDTESYVDNILSVKTIK
ncbi:SH3 domain-containing protein [Fretibacter rubidus]|uniref:SH3 domain-containing protein n=1 Tax=Fretibacter rubidus TaxID=570162 RepID=UPI00352A34FB